MRKDLKTLIVITTICVLSAPISVSASGTTAADFLNISVSAYQASLGGAGYALSDDIAAGYFNPAGLSMVDRAGVNFMHNIWYQDISYEFLGGAFPLGQKSAVAFSTAYLHMGQIDVYNELNQSDGTLNPYSMVGIVSYSRLLGNNLSLGFSGKYITEKLDDITAKGYAFDIGFQYNTSDFSVGAVANNLGPKMKYETESSPLPSSVSFGTSYSPYKLPVSFLLGAQMPFDGKTSFSAGLEYQMTDFMALRSGFGGMGSDDASSAVNFGAGFNFAGIDIDYAFNPGGDMGQTHFFSFTIGFGETRSVSFDNNQSLDTPVAPIEIIEPIEMPSAADLDPGIETNPTKATPNLFVVNVGIFNDKEAALMQIGALKHFGVDSKIEARDDGKFRVTIAETDNIKKAEKIQKDINAKGFACVIDSE